VDACKGGAPAGSNFKRAAHLTEITLIGVRALRSRKRIEWDAEMIEAKGLPELTEMIKETPRPDWELE
jgi:hypothetical protein